MQKKLEAELISIAHRILKLKNKSELDQLYLETGKLYEKLTVLKFVETHFAEAKPTIGHAEVSDKLVAVFEEPEAEVEEIEAEVPSEESESPKVEEPEEETASQETESEADGGVDVEIPEEEQVHSIVEEAEAADEEHEIQETEEVEEEGSQENNQDDFKPSFELSFEKIEETEDKKAPKQISFEDLLGGHDYNDEMFEKVEAKNEEVSEPEEIAPEEPEQPKEKEEKPQESKPSLDIDKSEYEKPAVAFGGKTITFGLNDRVGFEKNLFGGSSEDMNRVVSQLNTFNTLQEAQDFIEDMVKPDYNNWENKDDYAQRFMEIVEKKFS